MYLFDIPNKSLNSNLFAQENLGFTLTQVEDKLAISGNCTQAEAQAMLDAHNPPAPTDLTVEEKLASVGLNLDDLKSALGL